MRISNSLFFCFSSLSLVEMPLRNFLLPKVKELCKTKIEILCVFGCALYLVIGRLIENKTFGKKNDMKVYCLMTMVDCDSTVSKDYVADEDIRRWTVGR